MSDKIKVEGKKMLPKHCARGQQIATELNRGIEEFKLMSLAYQDILLDSKATFTQMKDILGDRYLDFARGKSIDLGKKEIKEQFEAIRDNFWRICTKRVELELELQEKHKQLRHLRKARQKFADKMFRYYKLDRSKTFRFDFATGKIVEAEQKIPPGVVLKQNQIKSN